MYLIEYYKKANGVCPVAEFLDSLAPKFAAKALRSIDLLEEKGATLREPLAKHIDGAIWELRVKFASDIARIFYFAAEARKLVLLNGFVKKTQKNAC